MRKVIKTVLKSFFRLITPLFVFFSKKISKIPPEQAKQVLTNCVPMPSGTALRNNQLVETKTCDLQIIIPAYNVEKYLVECLDSVLNQVTQYTFRIVLVDDGSTDQTPAIADRYASDDRVIVIHQQNRGLSGARNSGMEIIFGRYVFFLDSDDCLAPGSVQALMDTAYRYDSDIVEGGVQRLTGTKTYVHFSHPCTEELDDPWKGLHGGFVAKAFKAECLKQICFPEGYWFEDSNMSFLILPTVKRASVCSHIVYLYRINANGITGSSAGKPRAVETYWITQLLMAEREKLGLKNDERFLEKFCRQLVLNQKRMAHNDADVQESAFVLSRVLLRQYFSREVIEKSKQPIVRLLMESDWGGFKMYCKLYFF